MISDYLSRKERLDLVKAGALMLAGDMDAEIGPLQQVKEASGSGLISTAKDAIEAGNSLALFLSLSAGIPLGVFGHVMGRRIAGKRLREEELKEKIRLYRSATDEMAAGLGGGDY